MTYGMNNLSIKKYYSQNLLQQLWASLNLDYAAPMNIISTFLADYRISPETI